MQPRRRPHKLARTQDEIGAQSSPWLSRWQIPQLNEYSKFPIEDEARTLPLLGVLPPSPPTLRKNNSHARGSRTHRASFGGSPSPPQGARTARELGKVRSPRKSFYGGMKAKDGEPGRLARGFVPDATEVTPGQFEGWMNHRVWTQEQIEGQAWMQPLGRAPKTYLAQVDLTPTHPP